MQIDDAPFREIKKTRNGRLVPNKAKGHEATVPLVLFKDEEADFLIWNQQDVSRRTLRAFIRSLDLNVITVDEDG